MSSKQRGGGGGRGRGGSGNGGGRTTPRTARWSGNPGRRGGGSNNRSRGRGASNRNDGDRRPTSNMRDEDVLIAFMPYLKSNHVEAARIHEDYQRRNDQSAFLQAAREFLERQKKSESDEAQTSTPPLPPSDESCTKPTDLQDILPAPAPLPTLLHQPQSPSHLQNPQHFQPPSLAQNHQPLDEEQLQQPQQNHDHDLYVEQQSPQKNPFLAQPQQEHPSPTATAVRQLFDSLDIRRPDPPGGILQRRDALTPDRPMPPGEREQVPDTFKVPTVTNSLHALWTDERDLLAPSVPKGLTAIWNKPVESSPHPPILPSTPTLPSSFSTQPHSNQSSPWAAPVSLSITTPVVATSFQTTNQEATRASTPPRPTLASNSETTNNHSSIKSPPPAAIKKEAPPPKRLWTHFEEQPGRISVDGCNGQDFSIVITYGPRQELSAQWSLPISYLSLFSSGKTMNDALQGMTVGLFRRGCTENGTSASIISKAVLGDDHRNFDYWNDGVGNICGRVPFYAPRTPGYVLFRLFDANDPVNTLAMGPTIHVRVAESDLELSLRFLLSNFKGKKSNPTSLSTVHALASVLETPVTRPNESAARAAWGCIQEARKVMECCWQEYTKTTAKMTQLEQQLEDLKKEEIVVGTTAADDDDVSVDTGDSELKEKTKALLSGRASCERKWRDSQLAFASILRAIVTNASLANLLRRDWITKMRVEFELWCPLSEEFASAEGRIWYEPIKDLPPTVTPEDFLKYAAARVKMQMRTLQFEPNTSGLDDILFPRNNRQRTMDPGVVAVLNRMSAAMGKYYQTLFANEATVVRLRELIREQVEKCVAECGAFPEGTRVVIFGSSANGFGSPQSDIDMCLQLPSNVRLDEGDDTGAGAMAKLATYLEAHDGMRSVDAARLTARIPIIMFQCASPFQPDQWIECDLSMQNPLAVLNTAYLRSYAEITPVTRVLAAVVKRWAKARDINNPARHTLSSYGYIIMLLHFLTYHRRTGNGLIAPVAPPEGSQQGQGATPILPNLHWMDPSWPLQPKGTLYREIAQLPQTMMDHPFTEGKRVNIYYCRSTNLQPIFPGQDLSLAILLASFFRYYAYEFDYKRHVVSMHSTARRGLMEREVKAELDGWRNYSAALTIEDPFETFYDVAHVLRGGYYHRIRREFAVAYTKIADALTGRAGLWNKGDLRSMSGEDLIDWLCEPTDRDQQQPQIPG